MEITITHNVNINAPALIDFFKLAMATPGNPPRPAANPTPAGGNVPTPASTISTSAATSANSPDPTTPAFLRKEVAAAEAGKTPDPLEGAPKSGRRGGKKDPTPPVAGTAPAAAAPAAEGELTLEIVRARLSDYSADKRYGMNGVFKILADFGVDRITALPKDRYVDFKRVIDEALAKPAVDPLA